MHSLSHCRRPRTGTPPPDTPTEPRARREAERRRDQTRREARSAPRHISISRGGSAISARGEAAPRHTPQPTRDSVEYTLYTIKYGFRQSNVRARGFASPFLTICIRGGGDLGCHLPRAHKRSAWATDLYWVSELAATMTGVLCYCSGLMAFVFFFLQQIPTTTATTTARSSTPPPTAMPMMAPMGSPPSSVEGGGGARGDGGA